MHRLEGPPKSTLRTKGLETGALEGVGGGLGHDGGGHRGLGSSRRFVFQGGGSTTAHEQAPREPRDSQGPSRGVDELEHDGTLALGMGRRQAAARRGAEGVCSSGMKSESLVVAVIGAGSWGTALAIHAARRGHRVRLWARRAEHAAAMRSAGRNERYLPEGDLSKVEIVESFDDALADAELIIWAVPSHALRQTARRARSAWARCAKEHASLIAAKGVEVESLKPMAVVLADELPPADEARICALGGPSFAAEVAAAKPTAVVVGCANSQLARDVAESLSGEGMRAYHTDDVIGVELGGAFKNVIALASGIIDGAGLGTNARAALITRGLHEMARLAEAFGAHPATLSGLAGLGDLVLTCTGGLSRNRRVGVALGEGRALQEILDEMGMVAEGVKNAQSAHALAEQLHVEMPIVEVVHAILYDDFAIGDAVAALMGRGLKRERQ